MEPVLEGTNFTAVNIPEIDILAHPGLITVEEAEIARDNDIALEISSRRGHCLANGYVAKVAMEVGANLVMDTDTHAPEDLISYETALKIIKGAGIPDKEVHKILRTNPLNILGKNGY